MKNASVPLIVFFFLLITGSCEKLDSFLDYSSGTPGDTLWIHDLPGSDSLLVLNSLALGKDGSIYYGAGGVTWKWTASRIHAINPDDGSLKWRTEALDHIDISSRIVVGDDGTIYVCGFYRLYAIDPSSGAFNWIWTVPETLPLPEGGSVYAYGQVGALALTDEGDLLLGSIGSGVYSRTLYKVSKSGNLIWYNRDAVGGAINSGISIGKNQTAFYMTAMMFGEVQKNAVVSVDVTSGSIRWKTEIKSWGSSSNNIAIADDGYLYVAFSKPGENEVHLQKMDPENGHIVWSGPDVVYPSSKLINKSGHLVLLDGGFKIFDTGGTRILEQTGQFGCVDDQDRMVGTHLIDWKNHLGWFTTNGDEELSVEMAGLMGNELLISKNKVVYGVINLHPVSRIPSKICAIQGDGKIAESQWPRVAHDNRNTSNCNKE